MACVDGAKTRYLYLFIGFATCLFGLTAQAKYGGGSGTAADPYLISTPEQMNEIGANSSDWNKHFKLMEDIDLNAYTGEDYNIIGSSSGSAFTGVFDGNGKKIYNFTYSNTYHRNNIGVFGYVDGAQIRNLGLINPTIHLGTRSNYIGSLAGYVIGNASIEGCYAENCSIPGSTESTTSNNSVGGPIGAIEPSSSSVLTIADCYATGTVSGFGSVGGLVGRLMRASMSRCYSGVSVTGSGGVGGLVGGITGSSTSDSYSLGSVTGINRKIGGLVGHNFNGTLTNCYSAGHVTGPRETGGLLGYNTSGGSISSCFWNSQTSGRSNMCGYQDWTGSGCSDTNGKTTAEMQTGSTFTSVGWDFVGETANGTDDIWSISESDYPKLTWQLVSAAVSPDLNGDGKVDFTDFSQFAQCFSQAESSVDMAPSPLADGIVDFNDLAVFCDNWLKEILPVGLIAYWKLDETEDSIAHDSAGAYDATLNGETAWQPTGGKVNGALLLDGIDDYVNAGFVLDPGEGAFSAFAWIKGGGPGQVIISQADGTGFGGTWLAADPANGKLITNLMFLQLACESVITDDHWHHIGLVWDGSRRYLYVDGAQVAADTSGVFPIPCDGDLYFGAGKYLDAGSFWYGLIDDVRIYDRVVRP